MSREVMGATPDDDRYQVTGTDDDVSHDLDAADTDADADADTLAGQRTTAQRARQAPG